MIICYTVLEIWHVTDVIVVFHFGQFFALLPPPQPLTAQKMKKTPDILIPLTKSFYFEVDALTLYFAMS